MQPLVANAISPLVELYLLHTDKMSFHKIQYQPVIRHNAQHSGRTLSTTPITLTSNTPISSSSAFGLSSISKLLRRGPLDEDEDLSTAKSELEQLENRWGHVAANIGAVGKGRRVLAVAQADTGGKIASLSTVESSGELGAVYKKIGRVWENAAGLQQAQVSLSFRHPHSLPADARERKMVRG